MIEQYYKDNREKLIKKVKHYVGNYYNAEDVVQETFYKALKYYYSFDKDRDFDNWIKSILFNTAKEFKVNERNKGMTRDYDEDDDKENYNESCSEIPKGFLKALKEVKGSHKQILELYYIHDYKPKEIAKITNLSSSLIRSCVFNFNKKFRENNNE